MIGNNSIDKKSSIRKRSRTWLEELLRGYLYAGFSCDYTALYDTKIVRCSSRLKHDCGQLKLFKSHSTSPGTQQNLVCYTNGPVRLDCFGVFLNPWARPERLFCISWLPSFLQVRRINQSAIQVMQFSWGLVRREIASATNYFNGIQIMKGIKVLSKPQFTKVHSECWGLRTGGRTPR